MRNITLTTNRLILRKFTESDITKCFENFGQDEEIGKYLPMYPVESKEQMGEYIKGYIEAYKQNAYIWVIEEKDTLNPIGYITVNVPYEELEIGEIAYLLGVKYQGKGYAYEAVSEVVDYLLTKKLLYMIEAKYNINNIASGHLLSKVGFRQEAIFRDRRLDREKGRRCNVVVSSITYREVI